MKKNIAIVATVPMFIDCYLKDQIKTASYKYSVTVITNINDKEELKDLLDYVHIISLPIERSIHPVKDFFALWSLVKIFRRQRFDLVHSVTPKAGLLTMIAASLVRLPVKMHTFTGQVWVNKQGVMRGLLKLFDWLIASLADVVLIDSSSQKQFLIDEGIVSNEKSLVLGKGSISGVDLDKFCKDDSMYQAMRAELGIDADAKVILFIGRLTKDKGIIDLARAFLLLHASYPEFVLIVVGPDEEKMQLQIEEILNECWGKFYILPRTRTPEKFMQMADILCLPSYREGFGSSIIEAAACGIPSIGSNIYGLSDAIVDRKTGLLFNAGNVDDLKNVLERMMRDNDLRLEMGSAALERAHDIFSQEYLTNELLNLYASLLMAPHQES